jgi:hypothetical protein
VSLSEAEAEACLQGLTLVAEWIRQPTIVEPDYTEDRSQWAVLVDEIKAVRHLLPACSFSHVKTDGNMVARQLARRAIKHSECVVRRCLFPPFHHFY